MKRADALAHIRIAGYHDDQRARVRLFVENRVSKAAADEAWRSGIAARNAGVKCSCYQCNHAPGGAAK